MDSSISKPALWVGRVVGGIVILFLVFDVVAHVLQIQQAVETTTKLGWPASLLLPIGMVEAVCLVLYCIPRTSILGAVLLTGYLGGAIATNWRAGTETFNIVFPLIIGAMIWGAIYLRLPAMRRVVSS